MQSTTRPMPSPERPTAISVLAILAAVAGVLGVLGVLAGAFLIHGLSSLDGGDAVRVLPGLALAGSYLVFARGAWTLKSWAWTLGVVIGVGTIAYLSVILAVEWAELMRDGPPLAWASLLVILVAATGLVYWLRPEVRAAFDRE